MPLPTIADVYRVAFVWTPVNGISPANIVHMRKASSSESDIASVTNDAMLLGVGSGNMFGCVHSAWAVESLVVTKLDGSSPGFDEPLPDGPFSGTHGGDSLPSTCGVISFKTAQKGPRGRGRIYLGPSSEIVVGGGSLEAGVQTELLDGWTAFLNHLSVGDVEFGVASYVHRDFHPLTSFRVDTLVGTQRRRQDSLR